MADLLDRCPEELQMVSLIRWPSRYLPNLRKALMWSVLWSAAE